MANNITAAPKGCGNITKTTSEQTRGESLAEYDSLINFLDKSFHSLGQSLIAVETILPLYISNFTDSKLAIGLIPFLTALFFSFPQLFVLIFPSKKFKSSKEQIIFFGILERVPWLILGILTFFVDKITPQFMLLFFYLFYSLSILGWGCSIPLWFSFLREIIADHIKGSFFATIILLKSIFGFVGGILLLFLLKSFRFPLNFSYTFILAFILMSISLLFFSLNKKPTEEIMTEQSSYQTITLLFSIFKEDTEFLFLAISFTSSLMLFSIIPFLSLYAKVEFNLLDSSGGILTAVFFIGQTLGSIFGSYFGNRRNYNNLMFFSILFGMATIFIAMLAKTILVYYISFLFVGFSLSTRKLSFIVYVMNASQKEKTPIYIAILNNVSMPFQIAFPLIASLVVEYCSYNTLFLVSLFCLLLGFFALSYATRNNKTP